MQRLFVDSHGKSNGYQISAIAEARANNAKIQQKFKTHKKR